MQMHGATSAAVTPKRHYYSASAAGVGVVLEAPAKLAQSWAGSALPIIGGRGGSVAGPVVWPSAQDPLLSFEEAWSEITGGETEPGTYTTTIQVAVTNLNILNMVTGSINVTFMLTYKDDPPPRDDRRFDELTVDIVPDLPYASLSFYGVPRQTVRFDKAACQNTGQKFSSFMGTSGALLGSTSPPLPYYRHPHDVIFASLATSSPELMASGKSFGRLDLPDPKGGSSTMSVYFGEWLAEPYRQNFTLLRVELKDAQDRLNPKSFFTGQIVIDEDPNGRTG